MRLFVVGAAVVLAGCAAAPKLPNSADGERALFDVGISREIRGSRVLRSREWGRD